MTGIRELKQVLAAQAEQAPDGDKMIEAVRAGAVRFRRRRMRYALGAVAGAVLVAGVPAVIIGVVGDRHRPTVAEVSPMPASPSALPSHPARPTFQLTLDLAAESRYLKQSYGVVGVAQYLVARRSDEDETDFGASVALYDPGTLDAAALQRGERITVRGHPAYYVADFPAGQVRQFGEPGMVEARLPVVGWLDPPGGWILVYDNRDRDSLVRVAQDVRVGTARQVKTPFRLGHVPAGLPGAASVTFDSIPAQSNSVTGFGDVGTPTLVDLRNAGITPTLAMHIQVVPRDEYVNSHTRALGPATKIAGLDTWYITTQDKGMRPPERGSILVVNARNCQASIIVQDRNQIPYAEMTLLVEQATFADCQNPATWTPPLP